jgi:two-component system, LytTR family, sensor kinase
MDVVAIHRATDMARTTAIPWLRALVTVICRTAPWIYCSSSGGATIIGVSARYAKLKRVTISYGIAIVVWLVFAVIVAYQYRLIATSGGRVVSWADSLLLPSVRFFCYALLTPPIFYIVKRFPIDFQHKWRRSLLYVIGTAGFTLCFCALRWLILPPFDISARKFVARSFDSFFGIMAGTFADQISMYLAIVAVAHAYSLFSRSHQQDLEKSELQEALSASELHMLKAQIHPHFLFNTLHGISTLIDTEPAVAKSLIVELSKLLRTVLKHSSADVIALTEESKFVEGYLQLQRMRLGSRLQVTTNFTRDTLELLVPKLILLPLVENAVAHGASSNREGGWVAIDSRQWNGALELTVKNSVGVASPGGTGVGIPNTRGRLKHLYGDEAQFTFQNDGSVAEAVIRLPILQSTISESQPRPVRMEAAAQED